jgi:hypothetical protein
VEALAVLAAGGRSRASVAGVAEGAADTADGSTVGAETLAVDP